VSFPDWGRESIYSQQNNNIAQVKLGSSIEIAREAACIFLKPGCTTCCVREFASNNQWMPSTFLRSQHRVTNNYKTRSCANLHWSGSCIFPMLFQSPERNFLWVQSHSPVPQSSPESSPPNRDGPDIPKSIQSWQKLGIWQSPLLRNSFLVSLLKRKNMPPTRTHPHSVPITNAYTGQLRKAVLAYFAAALHSQTTHHNSHFSEKGLVFTNSHRTRLSEKFCHSPHALLTDQTEPSPTKVSLPIHSKAIAI